MLGFGSCVVGVWVRALIGVGVLVLGLVFSAPVFAAPPEAPVTEAAGEVTPTSAVLHGELNPTVAATTGYEFSYNAGGVCGEGPMTPIGPEATGSKLKVSSVVTELVPSREYTFCVVATHTEGETTESTSGPPVTFTTPGVEPSIDEESVSGVGSHSVVLNAQVNPENQRTTSCVFEYGTGPAYGTSVPCQPEALQGFGDQPVALPVSGLEAARTYHYRVVVENATGRTEGADREFTTITTPAATIDVAHDPTRTTVLLSGTVNPQGAASGYHFVYVPVEEYEAGAANPYARGGTTPEYSVGPDYTVHVAGPLQAGELRPGTTYRYALLATNQVGNTTSPSGTFTTLPPTPPVAVTGGASGVTALSSTVTGTVDTRSLQTILQFEFGSAPYTGSLTRASVTLGTESGSTLGIEVSFGAFLQPGTSYYYRTVATNTDGTSYGEERSFTTGPLPSLPTTVPGAIVAFPASLIPTDPKAPTLHKKTTNKKRKKPQKKHKQHTKRGRHASGKRSGR